FERLDRGWTGPISLGLSNLVPLIQPLESRMNSPVVDRKPCTRARGRLDDVGQSVVPQRYPTFVQLLKGWTRLDGTSSCRQLAWRVVEPWARSARWLPTLLPAQSAQAFTDPGLLWPAPSRSLQAEHVF